MVNPFTIHSVTFLRFSIERVNVTAVIWSAIYRLVSNKLMSEQPGQNSVEWAYCFDVHLNAFFPLALGVYGIQLLLWPCTHTIYILWLNAAKLFEMTCVFL